MPQVQLGPTSHALVPFPFLCSVILRTPCGGHTLCGHLPGVTRVHLRVIRNDQLSLNKDFKAKRNQPWVRFLRVWKPDILILNRGAHYRSSESPVEEAFLNDESVQVRA